MWSFRPSVTRVELPGHFPCYTWYLCYASVLSATGVDGRDSNVRSGGEFVRCCHVMVKGLIGR